MFGFLKKGGNKGAWLIAIVNVIIFSLISLVVPQFIDIFSQLGADLPALTKFMLNFHGYTGLLGAIGLIGATLIQFNHHQSGWLLIGISSSLVFVTIVLTVISMYLPIFTMGQVVN